MPRIAVIIVNYNAGERLARCLAHLAAQTFRDFETIVIDNASTDDSLQAARDAPFRVRVIEAGANLGFAAGNNRAVEATQAEWLAFLNPDAYASPDWLERLIEATARHPHVDAFGSTQIDAKNPAILDGAGDVYNILGVPYRGGFGWPSDAVPEDGECFAPCGAAAFYRRQTFVALGGFDESFFCYCEDVDLGFRLRLAGGRAVQLKDARVLHEGSGVTGRRSDFTIYHGNRNRTWLAYKNLPGLLYWPLLPIRLLADAVFLLRACLRGDGNAYARALAHGYGRLSEFRAARRRIQAERKASLAALARMIDWSPLKTARRGISLRPIRDA